GHPETAVMDVIRTVGTVAVAMLKHPHGRPVARDRTFAQAVNDALRDRPSQSALDLLVNPLSDLDPLEVRVLALKLRPHPLPDETIAWGLGLRTPQEVTDILNEASAKLRRGLPIAPLARIT